MNMKKILLSIILLALCLIQASAGNYYYYKIQFSNGQWTSYIAVGEPDKDGVYANGLRKLLKGETVTDERKIGYTLHKTADNKVNWDEIYGIAFANGKGKDNSEKVDILPGDEYDAWSEICSRIKYLELRDYIRDTYTGGDGYFMGMSNLEKLELPKGGMKVGDGDNDCRQYFANANKLKEILIYKEGAKDDKVDITKDANTTLLNRVGKLMFSNCYSLSTKYINRLIKDVTEIKDNAFKADEGNRGKFSEEADNKMPIEIPNLVTKIGDLAFWNRVKVTGLNIQGDGNCLEIGSEAFRECDELATIKIMQTLDKEKELKIDKDAFMRCKQLNAFENINNAKITVLGTGVFRECRSMTNDFVNGVLDNYARNRGTKIPAYLFFGCNGQDGHDGSDPNKNVCSFTDLIIPEQFTEIGDGAFASVGDAEIKLKTITVNSGMAPTCLQNSGDKYVTINDKKVFDGLDPNMTTVIFANNATGWNKDATTGFLTYMNDGSEFQRLLTKDLYSDHTEYINVPQQHAIVKLHRTLKVGWNTICLPFGVNNRYGSMWHELEYSNYQACNARIIVNGLTHTNTNNNSDVNHDNFTMGVYRGYWPAGKTFMFLHYTNFDEYPLDLGETFLVKMRPEDIEKAEKEKDNKGVDTYTFRNVDLNYSWSGSGTSGNEGVGTEKIYPADKMLQAVKDFDGSVNIGVTPFNKASYDEYVLRGSFVQRTGTVGDSQITTGDYFFQQSKDGTMKLYPYTAGKTYGIRGFSGWFHQKDNSNAKASEFSISLFDDSGTTPIETIKVDDLNRDTSGKVYSISGVLMKNNAADLNNLPKGIYVVNGKKYVVR